MHTRRIFSVILSYIRQFGRRIRFGSGYLPAIRSIVERGALIRIDKPGSIQLGDYTTIRSGTELHADGGKIIFEGRNFVNRNCSIVSHECIRIAEGVTIGPGTLIYDHDHDTNSGGYISRPVSIGKNAWIGAGCIILKGSTIGENSTVAAGALVSGDVPPNVTYINKRTAVTIEKSTRKGAFRITEVPPPICQRRRFPFHCHNPFCESQLANL